MAKATKKAPAKAAAGDDYEQQQALVKKVYAAGAACGLDEQDVVAYVMRNYNIDIAMLPIDDLEKCVRDLTNQAETLPMSDGMNTSERVTGKSFHGDFTENRVVERPWTQDEVDRLSDELLQEMTRVKDLTAEKKDWVSEQNEKIGEHQALVDDLHEKLVRGTDISKREVKIHRNFEKEVREIFDAKTGALIDTEPLTGGDRQLDLTEDLEENARREEIAEREGTTADAAA